jgi:hypothetical protein
MEASSEEKSVRALEPGTGACGDRGVAGSFMGKWGRKVR